MFGGFSGAARLSDAAVEAAGAASALPSELQLALAKLQKRDATTKLKALAVLEAEVLRTSDAAFWPLLLPPLLASLPRLVSDASRAVRCATVSLCGSLVRRGGRSVAPFSRRLLALWLPLQFDPEPEVAAAADASLTAAFPGAKRAEALVWCSEELRGALLHSLSALKMPADLPDPGEAGAEEGQDRLARVHCAALRTLALLAAGAPQQPAGEPALRPWVSSARPELRAAAYALLTAQQRGGAEPDPEASWALGRALAEPDASALPEALGCALALLSSLGSRAWEPSGGASVGRMESLFRSASFCAAASASAAAALPLLSQLPSRLLYPPQPPPKPSHFEALLRALWSAREAQPAGAASVGRARLGDAFRDCAVYAPLRQRQAAMEAGVGEEEAAELQAELLGRTLLALPLPAALREGCADGEARALCSLLAEAVTALTGKASLGEPAKQALWAGLAQAAATAAAAGGCEAPSRLASALAAHPWAASKFAQPLCASLLGSQEGAPAPSGPPALLLSRLLALFGEAALPGGEAGAEALLQRSLGGEGEEGLSAALMAAAPPERRRRAWAALLSATPPPPPRRLAQLLPLLARATPTAADTSADPLAVWRCAALDAAIEAAAAAALSGEGGESRSLLEAAVSPPCHAGGFASQGAEAELTRRCAEALRGGGEGGQRALPLCSALLRQPRGGEQWRGMVLTLLLLRAEEEAEEEAESESDSEGEGSVAVAETSELARLWRALCVPSGPLSRLPLSQASALVASLADNLLQLSDQSEPRASAPGLALASAELLAALPRPRPPMLAALSARLFEASPLSPWLAHIASALALAVGASEMLCSDTARGGAARMLCACGEGEEAQSVAAAVGDALEHAGAEAATALFDRTAASLAAQAAGEDGEAARAALRAALRLLPRLAAGAAGRDGAVACARRLWDAAPLASVHSPPPAAPPPSAARLLLSTAAPLLRDWLDGAAGWRAAALGCAAAAGEALRRAREGGAGAAAAEAAMAVVAALFPLGEEATPSSSSQPSEAECAALLRLWGELQAADAAAAAAAAATRRYGGGEADTSPAEALQAAFAILAPRLLAFCAPQLEEGHWTALLSRARTWLREAEAELRAVRETTGASAASLAGLASAPRAASAAALLLRCAALPVEVCDPAGASSGDVVPYSSHGEAARRIAQRLAAADWPRLRVECCAAAAGCVLAAGAIATRCGSSGAPELAQALQSAHQRGLWAAIGRLRFPPASAMAAAESADAFAAETGGAGAITSLLSLLRLADAPEGEGESRCALAGASHALLLAPPLQLASCFGLDASVTDTPRVLALLDEQKDAEGAGGGAGATALLAGAEAAGLRTPLAALLVSCAGGAGGAHRCAMLAWSLPLCSLLSGGAEAAGKARAEQLRCWLAQPALLPTLLSALLPLLPMPSAKALRAGAGAEAALPPALRLAWSAAAAPHPALTSAGAARMPTPQLALLLLGAALAALPGGSRGWWADQREGPLQQQLEQSVQRLLSPHLVQRELAALGGAKGTATGLAVRLSGREVFAAYSVDEVAMEVVLRFAGAYPLRPPTADCSKRVGVSEARLRKWLLAISACLRSGGGVGGALELWADCCAREFEGVEACPICYMVVHAATRALPKLACKQCANKFHAACLYNRFNSSNRSECPICRTPFGTTV